MRPARLLSLFALAASAIVPQISAHAVQTLAWSFAIDCRIGSSSSGELGVTLPSGWYAVTVTGACSWTAGSAGTTVGTPCTLPEVGAVPCTSVSVNQVPANACAIATGSVYTGCGPSVEFAGCYGNFSVVVAGDCITAPVGLAYHDGGSMTAQFVDPGPGDNLGVLLVTVVWTPL